ncbi:MAG: DUF1552 domain-containing protein [Pseudomonadota bacterium]
MKKIDNRFRHLPEAEAIEMTEDLRLREAAPEAIKAEMKADDNGPKQEREAFIQKDRRSFMGLVAKSGIAAGLIKSSALLGGILANRHAMAQTSVNKRVVFVYINSGSASGTWLPSSSTQMNQVTVPYGPSGYAVSDICHFRQVDVITSGHSTAMNSLGVPNYSGSTMDKRIADVLGTTTVRKQIYLGAKATTSGQLCSNSGPCTDDPATALSDIFSGGGGGGGGGTTDNTYALSYNAQLRALDSIKSKLSSTEVVRYQEHTESLTKIKANLAAANSSSSTPSTACSSNFTVSAANHQATGRSQADIIVAALACGITKVAVLQLGNHQGDWKGHNTAFTQIAHDAAHSVGTNTGPFVELQRYISDVPAYLIKKLRNTTGPDGQALINSTVVVQVSCMGNGMDHTSGNGPFIVATQMPGFKSGFSASTGGNVLDLNGAIPKGLGLTGITMGSSTLGLV